MVQIKDNVNLGAVPDAGATPLAGGLPDTGGGFLAQGLGQVAQVGQSVADMMIQREIETEERRMATVQMQVESAADDFAVASHQDSERAEGFSRRPAAVVLRDWESRWGQFEQQQMAQFVGEGDGIYQQDKLLEALAVKREFARGVLVQAHEKAVVAARDLTLAQTADKAAMQTRAVPAQMVEQWGWQVERLEDLRPEMTDEEFYTKTEDYGAQFFQAGLAGYAERGDFAAVRTLLTGVNPETGEAVAWMGAAAAGLTPKELRAWSNQADRMEAEAKEKTLLDGARAWVAGQRDADLSFSEIFTLAQQIENPDERAAVVQVAQAAQTLHLKATAEQRVKAAARLWQMFDAGDATRGMVTAAFENEEIDAGTYLGLTRAMSGRTTAQKKEERDDARARLASDLTLAVMADEAGEKEIEAAYEAGQINAPTRTRLHRELAAQAAQVQRAMTAQEKEERKDAQALALFNGAMNGTALVDPTDADDRKKINRAFEKSALPLWAERPEQAAKMAMDVMRQLKIVPDALKRQVQGALLSSDAQAQAQGYALFAQIKREAPEAVGQFAAAARELGVGVWEQVTAGRELPEAFAVTRENLNPTRDPAVRHAREESLKGDEMAQVKADAIADYLDGHALPDGLAVNFSTVFDAEYLRTGSVATAQQEALEAIRNKWAVSDFGGGVGVVQRTVNDYGLLAEPEKTEEIQTAPKIMSSAPEAYYAVPGAPEGWMAEQLLADVQDLSARAGAVADFAASGRDLRDVPDHLAPGLSVALLRPVPEGARFYLVPDNHTDQARLSEKSWPVMTDIDGVYTPLLDARGAVVRWRPRWKDSPAFARLQAAQQADREAAYLNLISVQEGMAHQDSLADLGGAQGPISVVGEGLKTSLELKD